MDGSVQKARINLLRKHLLSSSSSKHTKHEGQLRLRHVLNIRREEEVISIVDSDGEGCSLAVNINPSHPELVPRGYLAKLVEHDEESGDVALSQEALKHLQFMMKKQEMGQDVFLLGPPSQMKRALALGFCELFQIEAEYVAISQDTTVSDLKQRREIRNGSAIFTDGPAVKSAIYGRILVLDGTYTQSTLMYIDKMRAYITSLSQG